MTTALIFAGGKSSRMGRDKAAMYGGVARLIDECSKAGINKIITLCGAEERKSAFSGEVWSDPENCTGLIEVLQWALSRIDDEVLLIPCDAFGLTAGGITAIKNMPNCVPIDEDGMRQPLHAKITNRDVLNWQADSINQVFAEFPPFQNEEFISEFNNFNSPEDLKNLRLR